ncbi:MerR family transcriptional regulator [Kribbella sp. NPDC020789]
MRIAEAAEATGTTARALRWYEQQGLLTPPRTSAGYRDYGNHELRRIRSIRILQAAGFTLADLTTFTDLLDQPVPDRLTERTPSARCARAIATTRARLTSLDRHLEEMRSLRDRLATLLDDASAPAADCHPPLSEGSLPTAL